MITIIKRSFFELKQLFQQFSEILLSFSKIQEKLIAKRDHEMSTNSSKTLTTFSEDLSLLFCD